MITTKDQEELFTLISKYLKNHVTATAIGGTAMMFYGYINITKDIDLIFATKKERDAFIAAITELGYKQKSLREIYDEKHTTRKNSPLLFSRGDERFDIFLQDVFGITLPESIDIVQRHDFPDNLTINILPITHLIALKAVTNRPRDYEDIVTIAKIEKKIDWDAVVDFIITQKKENQWILLDLEEMLQKLKDITFIPQKIFDKIYKAQH